MVDLVDLDAPRLFIGAVIWRHLTVTGVEKLYLSETLQLVLGGCAAIHSPLCEHDLRQSGRRCWFDICTMLWDIVDVTICSRNYDWSLELFHVVSRSLLL